MTKSIAFRSRAFGANGVSARSLGKPAPVYPAAVATDSDMIIAVDLQQTHLLVPMSASDASMSVADPSVAVSYSLLTIDAETVKVTGPAVGNAVPVLRGFDGSTPAVHLASAAVSGFVDAYHHNRLVAEIEAIEQALGPNLSRIPALSQTTSTAYNFAPQAPGGSLSVGNNVVNLAPVPSGVNGTDQHHYLYISGGTGTPEPVLITGGSAVSGAASGTVIVNCAYAHSGAWTIQTATGGGAEAMQFLLTAGNGGTVAFPDGVTTFHAPLYLPTPSDMTPRYSIRGNSVNSTILSVAPDFPLSVTGVLTYGGYLAGNISDLTILFPPAPNSTDISTYTHWPAAIDFTNAGVYGVVNNVDTINAWISVNAPSGGSGFVFNNMHISGFKYGMNFPSTGYGDLIRISNVYFGPNVSAVNQANNQIAFLHNAIGINIVSGYFGITNFQTFAHQFGSISGGYVNITNAQMDSAGLVVTGGPVVTISGGYCTIADPTVTGNFPYALQVSGGQVNVTNMNWEHLAAGGGYFAVQSGQSYLSLTNIFAYAGAYDVPFIQCTSDNSFLTVSGITYWPGTASPAGPFITMNASNTQLVAQGNMLVPVTANPAAKFLAITGNTGNLTITGNQMPGTWSIDASNPSNANDTIVIGNNNGRDTVPVTIASAATLNLPWGPKVFNLTGTAPVGNVTGIYEGETITFIPAGAVTFNASGTIGNTVTTVANVPLSGIVYGLKLYLH